MKKVVGCMAVVFAVSLGWAGCGGSGDVCVDAANVMLDGMKEACSNQSGCCFCDCLLQGKVMDFNNPSECTCVDGDATGGGGSGGECTGEAKAAAEQCLNNVDQCKSDAGSSVSTMCSMGG